MITVYTIAYNEELQLQFLIDHYRSHFTNCHIVVYDNMSTDATVEIAKANKCDVISYDTNNQICDSKYLEIKNNCWKNSQTDWVLICDVDELLDINEDQLKHEEHNHTSIIKSEGYNMINMEDNLDFHNMSYGVRALPYDKYYLFNKKMIQEINYFPGCHQANPIGFIKLSNKTYPAYHFNFINLQLSIEKYKNYGKRLSQENIEKGWGKHYLFNEETIRAEFLDLRSKAIKLF